MPEKANDSCEVKISQESFCFSDKEGDSMNFILVLILGVVGGIARSPFGTSMMSTLAVNFIGTFCLGLLSGTVNSHFLKSWLHDGLSAGLLGSFTTFSFFATGVVGMGKNHVWVAGFYCFGTMIGGLGFAYFGMQLSTRLYGSVNRSILRRRAAHQIKT